MIKTGFRVSIGTSVTLVIAGNLVEKILIKKNYCLKTKLTPLANFSEKPYI